MAPASIAASISAISAASPFPAESRARPRSSLTADRSGVSRAAASVKIFCSEMSGRAGERALQLYGGDGLKMRYGIDKAFRDQVITEIYEGTNEIQRMIIARELLAEGAQ